MRVGLATIQRGRLEHLARQARGVLTDQSRLPDRYVVLSMDPAPEPAAQALKRAVGPLAAEIALVHEPTAATERIPLARARNQAIRALGDVDLAILLDVDCIPGHDLVARYAAAHAADPTTDRLLAGPVAYLPPGRPGGLRLRDADRTLAVPPAARPVPADDVLLPETRHELFWSLSFAIRPELHERIGGFDERYVGYGGEDTDYAFRARRVPAGLVWVGGAWAYHQHHPVSDPPREHLAAIVDNARRFHECWGCWPMEGWLRAFAADGEIDWDPNGDELRLRSETAERI